MSYVPPLVNEFWRLAFDKEATFGIGETIADVNKWVGVLEDDPEIPVPDVDVQNRYGVDGDAKSTVTTQGAIGYTGKLSWLVQNAQMLEFIFGRIQTSGTTPTFTHDFDAGTALSRPLPSFTMAIWNDKDGDGTVDAEDIVGRFSGCKLPKAVFTSVQGEALKIEADLMAINAEDQSTFPSQTTVTTQPYMFDECQLTVFGAVFARAKEVTITLDHQAEFGHYLNDQKPIDIVEGQMKVEVSAVLVIEDDNLWDLLLANPLVATTITLLYTRGAIDTLQLQVTNAVPKIKINTGERGVEAPIDFICEDITAQVIDSVTSYPV
ncbi:MAG: phage tail tube protein [Thermodesulfobacteriota bacterium]